jgi:hypothetical protein
VTKRRFDSTGTMLSRTSEGKPPVVGNQEDLEVPAIDPPPLGVIKLRPVSSRRPTRPSPAGPLPRPGASTSARSARGSAPNRVPA